VANSDFLFRQLFSTVFFWRSTSGQAHIFFHYQNFGLAVFNQSSELSIYHQILYIFLAIVVCRCFSFSFFFQHWNNHALCQVLARVMVFSSDLAMCKDVLRWIIRQSKFCICFG